MFLWVVMTANSVIIAISRQWCHVEGGEVVTDLCRSWHVIAYYGSVWAVLPILNVIPRSLISGRGLSSSLQTCLPAYQNHSRFQQIPGRGKINNVTVLKLIDEISVEERSEDEAEAGTV